MANCSTTKHISSTHNWKGQRISQGPSFVHCLYWSQSSIWLWTSCHCGVSGTWVCQINWSISYQGTMMGMSVVSGLIADSAWFTADSGVRHGGVVAPYLSNCVTDHLMTCICQWTTGVWPGNHHLTDLEYADDTAMFSSTITDLKTGLHVSQEEASRLGFEVSWEKTKLVHAGDDPDPSPISVGTVAVEFVNFFNYLGSTVTNKGDLKWRDQPAPESLHNHNAISPEASLGAQMHQLALNWIFIMPQWYQSL